jgi:transposase-like protein
MANRQEFSLEVREQAVRRVIDGPRPIVDVAAEVKIHEGTLSNWVRQYRDEHPPAEKPLTISERARLAERPPSPYGANKRAVSNRPARCVSLTPVVVPAGSRTAKLFLG